MRNFLITACIVSGTLLSAGQEAVVPANSLFSYAEWQEIFSKRRCSEDFIVLVDGTKLCGHLDRIPSLNYSFATLELNLKDVAALSLSHHTAHSQLQFITRDGQNFIGSLGKGKFVIWVLEPTPKDPLHTVRREIDPKTVSFILLKERDRATTTKQPAVASITLRNGDQIPAILPIEPIAITNGWSSDHLPTESIVELYFAGGIYGKVLEQGNPVDLHFVFLRDRYLTVHIPGQDNFLRIPWDQIEYIQADNGGFKNDFEKGISGLHIPPDDLEEALQAGVTSFQSDSIGVKRGLLLTDASGAIALPAKAFEGFYQLGNVELQPKPLFASAEEQDWKQDIAFEEIGEEKSKDDEVALVTPDEVEEVSEEALFANLEKKDVDPPTFDVPTTNDKPEEKKPELTPQAIAIIDEILAEGDELDDLDYLSIPEDEAEEDAPALTDKAIAIIEDILADDDLDEVDFAMIGTDPEKAPVHVDEVYAIAEELLKNEPETVAEQVVTEVEVPVIAQDPALTSAIVEEVAQAKPEAKSRDLLWDPINEQSELSEDELLMLNELLGESDTPNDEENMVFVAQEQMRKALSSGDFGKYKVSLLPTANNPTVVINAPAFYIDRQPVTNAQYDQFVRETGNRAPVHWIDGVIPRGQEDKPVVNVSYHDAKLYAAWVGKRLPTETDWKRAVRTGAISQQDNSQKEWTATSGKAYCRVVVVGNESKIMNENYIDHRLTFRTVMSDDEQ